MKQLGEKLLTLAKCGVNAQAPLIVVQRIPWSSREIGRYARQARTREVVREEVLGHGVDLTRGNGIVGEWLPRSRSRVVAGRVVEASAGS